MYFVKCVLRLKNWNLPLLTAQVSVFWWNHLSIPGVVPIIAIHGPIELAIGEGLVFVGLALQVVQCGFREEISNLQAEFSKTLL
jgi:hypothetical protein